MEFAFYISAIVAVVATLCVVICTNPVHALLNLVVSLVAIAMVFFSLGAPFAGVLEIIVYAGAIMVLFVFVIMMLNVGKSAVEQEQRWLTPGIWRWPAIMSAVLLIALVATLFMDGSGKALTSASQSPAQVGAQLFGPYILVVELAAFLLLAALITASHVGRPDPAPSEEER